MPKPYLKLVYSLASCIGGRSRGSGVPGFGISSPSSLTFSGSRACPPRGQRGLRVHVPITWSSRAVLVMLRLGSEGGPSAACLPFLLYHYPLGAEGCNAVLLQSAHLSAFPSPHSALCCLCSVIPLPGLLRCFGSCWCLSEDGLLTAETCVLCRTPLSPSLALSPTPDLCSQDRV